MDQPLRDELATLFRTAKQYGSDPQARAEDVDDEAALAALQRIVAAGPHAWFASTAVELAARLPAGVPWVEALLVERVGGGALVGACVRGLDAAGKSDRVDAIVAGLPPTVRASAARALVAAHGVAVLPRLAPLLASDEVRFAVGQALLDKAKADGLRMIGEVADGSDRFFAPKARALLDEMERSEREQERVRALWGPLLEACANDDTRTAALAKHFAFLVDTEACGPLLHRLCERARAVDIDTGRLRVVFHGDGDDEDESELVLCASPPFEGALDEFVSPAHARFVRVHNGMDLENADVPLAFLGVDDAGAVMSGGFTASYLEGKDAELRRAWADEELPVEAPIDHHQDWVVYDYADRNEAGEPALRYLSHEGGGLAAPYPRNLGVTGVFLRLLAADVLGEDLLGTS